MAKKLELSNPRVAALMRQHKKLVPWRSATYNDEVTLMDLRNANPQVDWSTIREMLNEAVPSPRRRSMDSIKNKWRSLRARSRKVLQLAVIEPFGEDFSATEAAPAKQIVPEAHLKSGHHEDKALGLQAPPAENISYDAYVDSQHYPVEDQSTVSLETLNQNFAEYHEMLSTHWDSMANFEGHLNSFADEMEGWKAAQMTAIEAASGWSEGREW